MQVEPLYRFRRWHDPSTGLWTAEHTDSGTRAHGETRVQAEVRLRQKMALRQRVEDGEA